MSHRQRLGARVYLVARLPHRVPSLNHFLECLIKSWTVSRNSPKHAIYERLAEVAQALGHAHRLELLERMAQGAHSVEELANATGLTVANASRPLQLLRRARLVNAEREGKRVFYRLAGDAPAPRDRGDEPIAAARLRHDELVVVGRLAKHTAQHRDRLIEVVLLDDEARPDPGDQLRFVERLAGVLDGGRATRRAPSASGISARRRRA